MNDVIDSGRALAESLMTDFGVMRRPTGHNAQTSDGEEVPIFEDVFSSRCKIQGVGKDETYRTVTVGGVERELLTAGLHLPLNAPSVEHGWVFEVTKVGALSDIRLIGRRYYVHNDPVKSRATARRLDVVEV